jgi:hypothetical protein
MKDLRTYVTKIGFGLESQAKFKSTHIPFSQLVVGDGILPDDVNPSTQTDLINQVKAYPITIERDLEDSMIWIARAEIPADDGGYFINEAGIKDEDGNLYAYARQPGDYKPNIVEGAAKSYTIRMKFIPGNASAIEVKIDPSVQFSTPTDIEKKMEDHVNDEHPHKQYAKKEEVDQAIGNIDLSLYAKKVDLYPIGAPIPWASDVLPENGEYAFMKNQAFDVEAYPELAKVYSDGVLDDMRGLAIVGKLDSETVRAYEEGQIKAHSHSGSVSSVNLGSKTTNTTGNHRHQGRARGSARSGTSSGINAYDVDGYTDYAGNHAHSVTLGSHAHTLTINATGAEKNTINHRKFNFIVRMA